MYQFVYPWIHPDMFKLTIPSNNHKCTTIQKTLCYDADLRMAEQEKTKRLLMVNNSVSEPEITANHTEGDIDDQIFYAAQKFVQFARSRETAVTFHGANDCGDKKPWAQYAHFHVTVVSEKRLGVDSMYNNLVALHRKVARCHIPASQQTRFPASWANYLCQQPRVLWYANPHALIGQFASWTMDEYIDRATPPAPNRKRLFEETASTSKEENNPENATMIMKNGKVQRLYDYLGWLIKEFSYSTREDLINGALSRGTTDNFSRALIHPHFDTVLAKAFTMDRAIEINTPFKIMLDNMDWTKFQNEHYLTKEVSLVLFKNILDAQDISLVEFVNDVYDLLTMSKPKQNLLALEGVPNSGKSFIARSIAALYKYQNTCQGTTSFPFMEIASASIGLIEEPVFSNDALQTFKKLAEGTPTDVAVKNRKAARVPRIPLIITSNYDFVVQGGSTEKQAFASRMKKHTFTASCHFLKMAKKMLNPGIWQKLFDDIHTNDSEGESSDDTELREYLGMTKRKPTMSQQEAAEEAALLCSEPMFEEEED